MATNITTGPCRTSFVHVAEKQQYGTGDPKYSIMLLLPKSDTATYKKLKDLERKTAQESKVYGGKVPPKLNSIIQDGDGDNPEGEPFADKFPERAGHWFLTVRSTTRPGVVDRELQRIDPEVLYSGCWVRAALSCFAYQYEGKKGISFGLNNLQFVRDDEPLGGAASNPEDDFDAFEDDLI